MTKNVRKALMLAAVCLLVVCLILQPIAAYFPAGDGSVFSTSAGAQSGSSDSVRISYEEVPGSVAENYLLSNDGAEVTVPEDDDVITVIVKLGGTSMLDYATSKNMTVIEAMNEGGGYDNYNSITKQQLNAERALDEYIIEYGYNYTAVLNGFSAKIRYSDLEAVENNPLVEKVIISNSYSVPETITENYVDVYESGIFNSSGIGYDGTGTVVAVLDTGTDYTHEVFDMELDAETLAISKDDVTAAVSMLTAYGLSAARGVEINEDDLYYSSKLPFGYDYADKDTNIYPYESHGTHVAGIIAGKSDQITGVAPGAQIATFKVFGDEVTGAQTENILAALNDAVVLGVDAINMSLGSSCGFSREVDEENVNEVYDSVNAAGICLVVAASNSYSSAYASTWGNTNLASNPDSGTIGSPASYDAALAVASISGVKTKYFIADGESEIYFTESTITGKTKSNDFVAELLGDKTEGEYEYVVVPGIGLSINYTGLDVNGKIVLVKRGTSSFEEKVRVAKEQGAAAVIVYNNVSGTISMSVGTKYMIPSCSITMDLSASLVEKGSGTLKFSTEYLAGPFMSDFSSWGVLPDLKLSPDITAHGGEIYSAVAGTNQYDTYSGTSMASPNLAGALILVRQYVKQLNGSFTTSQIRDLSYSLLMSTATIVKNQEGNPYSPRKQGAGLADMASSVTTKAYLTVDGSNKPKLSLGDDPSRTGEYELAFNIVNMSGDALSYNINPVVMTEQMSSDEKTVAEMAYMLDDAEKSYDVKATKGKASLNGSVLSLGGYGEATITVKIKLTDADKAYLDANFVNGMYVEGYVKLESYNSDKIDLNIPYLAFYGDWSDAPMLDVTAYEVGESADDSSVLAEDKLVADVYATLPMAGFYSETATDGIAYNGLGAFGYIIAPGYTAPNTREEYASLTTVMGDDGHPVGNYLLYIINAGLLRSAKKVDMEIRDSVTGELIWSGTDYNARKSYASGSQIGGYVMVNVDIRDLGLANNSKYTFSMACYLDWEDENGEYTYGNNNTFSFEFTVDNETPTLTETHVREDKSGSYSKYYLDFSAFDNHYVQGYSLSVCDGELNEYGPVNGTSITSGVVPVSGEYNATTVISHDVTAYWNAIMEQGYVYISLIDYAKNTTSYLLSVGEDVKRESDVKVEKLRTAKDSYEINTNGQLDLKSYITVTANVGGSYLENYWYENLVWTSSNPDIVEVRDGVVTGLAEGSAVITVAPATNANADNSVSFTINVNGTETSISISGVKLSDNALKLERGESAVITAEIEPYNYTGDYSLVWSSTSAGVEVTVDPENPNRATIYAAESGTATVRAQVVGSLISGYCTVTVAQEFVVDGLYLRSYVGRGDKDGVVEIPDDLGIYYIYPGAFFGNEYITKIIFPEGVTTIMRAGVYGCDNLEEVVLSSTITTLNVWAFGWNPKLKTINLENVTTIDTYAFYNCPSLQSVNLEKCTYIGDWAFCGDTSLTTLDLARVGIVGGGAFAYCTSLKSVTIPSSTSLEYVVASNSDTVGAFYGCSGLTEVTILSKNLGVAAFKNCTSLKTVKFASDIDLVGAEAFNGCTSLETITFGGTVYEISDGAFAGCTSLKLFTLPNGLTKLGTGVFDGCSALTTVNISGGARLTEISAGAFYGLNLSITAFTVDSSNRYLTAQNGVLYDKTMTKLVAYPIAKAGAFTVPETVVTIGASAFFNVTKTTSVNLNNVEKIEDYAFYGSSVKVTGYGNLRYIGDYAFSKTSLTALPVSANTTYIGNYAFADCTALLANSTLTIDANIEYIGDYAFANDKFTKVAFASGVGSGTSVTQPVVGEGVFAYNTSLAEVDLGLLTYIPAAAFFNCTALGTVVIPDTVTTVGAFAFYGCVNLSSVTLPSSLTEIADYAFAGDSSLTSINLPATVTSIGDYAFADTALTSIDLSNIVTVGNSAFEGTALTSVTSETVKFVGAGAFANTNVETVSLPNAEIIGDRAFYRCTLLSSVNLPKAEQIGSGAFMACTSLETIALDAAEEIGDYAFYGDVKLSAVSIGSVKSIGAQAFYNTVITTVALPASLESVDDRAFYGADYLAAISVDESNKVYVSVDGVLYLINSGDFYTLVCYPHAKEGTEYTLIDRTVKVGAYAFSGNTNITQITLPAHMQVIGISAFSGMSSLEKITIKSVSAPRLESETSYNNFNFAYGASANLTIIVPSNGTGYDNYIWQSYVGDYIENSTEVHATLSTLDIIERIKALTANVNEANRTEIESLVKLYNLLTGTQKNFVNGVYNYTETDGDGNVTAYVDEDYYNSLLGGTNYYTMLTTARSKLPTVTPSNPNGGDGENGGDGTQSPEEGGGVPWYAWGIPLIVVVVAAAAVVAVILIRKKRSH